MLMYPEYDKEIAGLCHKKCSCDICKAARKADDGYQEYLAKKWLFMLNAENWRTLEDAKERDRMAGKRGWRGHEKAVRLFQEGHIGKP